MKRGLLFCVLLSACQAQMPTPTASPIPVPSGVNVISQPSLVSSSAPPQPSSSPSSSPLFLPSSPPGSTVAPSIAPSASPSLPLFSGGGGGGTGGSGTVTPTLPPEPTPTPVPVKWVQNLSQSLTANPSTPALSENGHLYIAGSNGLLLALRADSGQELWRYDFESPLEFTPMIGPDGTVYVGTQTGEFHALNADGTSRWVFRPERPERFFKSGAALDAEGTLYTGGEGETLYALDSTDGSLKWTFPLRAPLYSAPVVSADRVYLTAVDQTLYALNREDGTYLWEFQTGQPIIGLNPALTRYGDIIFGSQDPWLYSVGNDGFERWSFIMQDSLSASPVIDHEDTVYAPTKNGVIYAVNRGELLWEQQVGNQAIVSSPVIGFNTRSTYPSLMIYVGGGDGYIYAFSSFGRLEWKHNIGSPIATGLILDHHGILYGATLNGRVFALQTNSPDLDQYGWPKSQGNLANTGKRLPEPEPEPEVETESAED